MAALALLPLVAGLAGCATTAPEREQSDRVLLAAVEACWKRYSDLLSNPNLVSVQQDGGLRYYYRGDRPIGQTYEFERCLTEARKGLKTGPAAPGRLAKPGPANVFISTKGKDVLAPVRINGVLGTMVVRDSTEMTFVTADYAKRAGLRVVTESPTVAVRREGKTVAVPYARARAVELGEAQVEALDIAVHEVLSEQSPVDGVLGRSFLSHFTVSIDRRLGHLTLEPKRAR